MDTAALLHWLRWVVREGVEPGQPCVVIELEYAPTGSRANLVMTWSSPAMLAESGLSQLVDQIAASVGSRTRGLPVARHRFVLRARSARGSRALLTFRFSNAARAEASALVG